MQIVEVKCSGCGKIIPVLSDYLREKMFCTLGCMDLYAKASPKDGTLH